MISPEGVAEDYDFALIACYVADIPIAMCKKPPLRWSEQPSP